MEQETFLTGYCREMDGSRMVTLVTEDGEAPEVDCHYGNCPHQTDCRIAAGIRQILKDK